MRCTLHASLYEKNMFITLTYDETQTGYHNNLDYTQIQKFKKKLRRYVDYHYQKRIEVFNVHEYGKNGKKHWHLICFGFDFDDKELYTIKNQIPLYTSEKLEKLWGYGFVTIGDVSEASAMYQAQYMEKDFKNGHAGTNKKSKSKHQGIGQKYFLLHYQQILRLGYIPIGGRKLPLPRSFERVAHKHYCHYYDGSFFVTTPERKARYCPFKKTQPNREIADLYVQYKVQKKLKIKELEEAWRVFINDHQQQKTTPDFVTSCENAMYDLKNKTQQENF